METLDSIDPLPLPGSKEFAECTDEDGHVLTVGLTYNLKKGIKSDIEDIEAEYDSIETVYAIKEALEQLKCKVELLEADNHLFKKLIETKIDFVFNIAEGMHGRGREAQVPSILNFLKIPFAGSDETTLCIALDKALAKRILSSYKIRTPRYKLLNHRKPFSVGKLSFPLIVKPNAEGSSKGISDVAVVHNVDDLKYLVEKNITAYKQSMLVEEFVDGREFTVAIAGNDEDVNVFAPMEIKYKKKGFKHNIYSYNVKKNYKDYVEYVCPAHMDKKLEAEITGTARKIYKILECKDFARIDFRMSQKEELHFIEINPLPGLAPGYSDYPMITGFNGIGYKDTIKIIMNSALKRYGMKPLA